MEETILVTGGAGYIGSHVVKLLLENGIRVVVADNFSRGFRQSLEILAARNAGGSLEVREGDILDRDFLDKIFSDFDFSGVMHLAALCSVDESAREREKYFAVNGAGTAQLISAMRAGGKVAGVTPFIFSSTCAVYGEPETLPVTEETKCHPVNSYGESKLQAEIEIANSGFPYAILRYFNVCGAASDGCIGDSKRPSELLLQNAVRGAMNIADFYLTCPLVSTPDGTPIRDYVDVEDIARAHLLAYRYLRGGGESKILNLGNGHGFSVHQIVHAVEDFLGVTLEKKIGETRHGEYAQIYADATNAAKVLHWSATKTLRDSISSLKKWYQKFPRGYKY